MPLKEPPALPALFSNPDTQLIADALNRRLWEEELKTEDFGVVEALPTEGALKNDTCVYKVATGIYWELVFTEEATYPWAKVGGPPLRAIDANTREGTQTTYQTTGAPSVTAPLAGEYRIGWGAQRQGQGNVSTGDGGGITGVFINAVEQATMSAEVRVNDQHRGAPVTTAEVGTVPAGQAVQTRYKGINANGYRMIRLFVEIDPLRVG